MDTIETPRDRVRAPPARTWLLVFALAAAGLAALFSTPPEPPPAGHKIEAAYLPILIIEWLLFVYVHLADRTLLHSLRGKRFLSRDLAAGIAFALVVELLAPLFPSSATLAPTTNPERIIFILVALSAALSEEMVFRGYLQQQLSILLGNPNIALIAQAILFGLVHAQQGLRGVAMTFLTGLAFGWLARSLNTFRAGLAAHAILDLLAGFLG